MTKHQTSEITGTVFCANNLYFQSEMQLILQSKIRFNYISLVEEARFSCPCNLSFSAGRHAGICMYKV